MNFYSGYNLLNQKDINGKTPEIFISEGNRSTGKTTFFNRFLVDQWLKNKSKFGLLYRYNYELSGIADKFFKDIGALFFPDITCESKGMMKGVYHEIFLNGESAGYALAINSADILKKNSHLFSDIDRLLLDEMQPETGRYCDEELIKYQSIHMTVARGQGKAVRYVPVYMLGNSVSLINPYYSALGISERLRQNTKILRGDGFVLERFFNAGIAKAQEESGFNRAFAGSRYQQSANQLVYLNDNTAFIEKPSGQSKYVCTVKISGTNYAIRTFADSGVIYCDTSVDNSFPLKVAASASDHQVNYVMLKQNELLISTLRWYFERGAFRFKNLSCKDAILKLLSY